MSTSWNLGAVVLGLRSERLAWRKAQGRPETGLRFLPSRQVLTELVDALACALFPMRLGPPDLRVEFEDYFVGSTLDGALQRLAEQARLELEQSRHAEVEPEHAEARAISATTAFGERLPELRRLLDADILATWERDLAARSVDEVLLCYPGVQALIHHRIAHALYDVGLPLIARMVAAIAHTRTGIDIHPGARIQEACFIDHGTGLVIGETAVLGARVHLHQHVTLGAADAPPGARRHPLVEDDVVIHAGATLLGPITVGAGSVIGGNVWLVESVGPGSRISQATVNTGA